MARAQKDSGWSSTRQAEHGPSALRRLRNEFKQSSGAITTPAKEVFAAGRGGLAVKTLTVAETLVDLSASPFGRLITAVLALIGAWALL